MCYNSWGSQRVMNDLATEQQCPNILWRKLGILNSPRMLMRTLLCSVDWQSRTVVFRVEDAAKEDLFTNITVCLSHLMPSCS